MKLIYRTLLTISSTSWMIIIYSIKIQWTLFGIPPLLFGLILFCIPVILSFFSILLAVFLEADELKDSKEYSLADNEFLPTYLGYFFLGASITECRTLWFIFSIIFVFTFLSQAQYFNPIYLLFGYHYYHILTGNKTRVFVISRGRAKRTTNDFIFENLKRINDSTYIERK